MPSQHAQPINCTTAVRLKARWNGLRCYASSIGSIAHTAIEFTSQRHSSRSHAMPTFRIELFEGRSLEQKRQFVEAITKATCESLGVEPNSVDIILTDVKRENWATGGRLWSEPDA
ncbi:4-oxalocrotonate tautomerase [Paraburkholderia aspalathi]|uniref:4-oxalocrotonate tautomerase n=1 Tax=Paraburkholderia aspalathi TaxID=1324617 RepID=UPI001BA8D16F|nr:4-oxalocrotonate tautomerase [Paraburkholderia aspalathi]